MTFSILNLCARIESHGQQHRRLTAACSNFSQWDKLLYQAEDQGMGPLLHRHLAAVEGEVPDTFLRGLRFLIIRHQQANILLTRSLHFILSLFEEEGIPSLVLKGSALCRTLYPEIGLRPMRDIDLLLAREDVQHGHALLQEKGFRASTAALPDGYFHLPPLFRMVDGMQICVELHHGLFPDDPPYYQSLSLVELSRNALAFEVDGLTAYTLANEEMLWHLYQHGFHAPLTYEPYRLISVADVVSFVEHNVGELDWEKIRGVYPQLYKILPLFHYITPWNDTVIAKILYEKHTVPSAVGEPFNGWPRQRFTSVGDKKLLAFLWHTFVPGQWWLMLYYSTEGLLSFLWARLVRHPLHILRWLKIYATAYLTTQSVNEAKEKN